MLFFILFSFTAIVFIAQCNSPGNNEGDPRGNLYAGSAACISCHKNISRNFSHTFHFLSTRIASETTIGGPLTKTNTFTYTKNLKVSMEKRSDGFYQIAYLNGKEIEARRFDIVIGGIKAESYLYWKGDKLFQLPISYFRAIHSWTNSPGYDTTFADYTRPITVGCLECHSSYIKGKKNSGPDSLKAFEFDKKTFLMGIDCERCHGPAADHVYYQTTHPEDNQAKHIITYASLSREQRVNMCAVCHSGSSGTMLRSTFDFKPNDRLNDYKLEDIFQTTAPGMLDVHGDQSRLLASSKCYIMSAMDCATCHDLHKNERNQLALYSQKCTDCHTIANHNFCKLAPVIGNIIKTNCIDCHMPAKSSNRIAVATSGLNKVNPYLVRTHYITIYKDESQKVLSNLKNYHRLLAN